MRIKCILFLFFVSTTSVLFAQKGEEGNGGNQIMERRSATLFSLPPVVTIISSNNIDLYFGSNAGVIEVKIKNKRRQIVYKKIIDTSIDNTFQLDLQRLSSGAYHIVISNQRRFILKEEKFLID